MKQIHWEMIGILAVLLILPPIARYVIGGQTGGIIVIIDYIIQLIVFLACGSGEKGWVHGIWIFLYMFASLALMMCNHELSELVYWNTIICPFLGGLLFALTQKNR